MIFDIIIALGIGYLALIPIKAGISSLELSKMDREEAQQ